MKLFQRHGGHWLFWTSVVYLILAFWTIYHRIDLWWLQPLWLLVISLPLTVPPLGRWLNLDIEWDRKMFDWFSRKEYPKYQPEGLGVPEYTESKKEEKKQKPATTYYRVGLTDDQRVSLQIGYGEITMNPQGVQNLIDQLELFKRQLMEDFQPSKNTKEHTE